MGVRFIPECHADTALVMFFVKDIDQVDHRSGIGAVAKEMKDFRDGSVKLVGLIDKDKTTPKYFDLFVEVAAVKGVSLKKHRAAEHYVIVLEPAIERFLMDAAGRLGLLMSDFDLHLNCFN